MQKVRSFFGSIAPIRKKEVIQQQLARGNAFGVNSNNFYNGFNLGSIFGCNTQYNALDFQNTVNKLDRHLQDIIPCNFNSYDVYTKYFRALPELKEIIDIPKQKSKCFTIQEYDIATKSIIEIQDFKYNQFINNLFQTAITPFLLHNFLLMTFTVIGGRININNIHIIEQLSNFIANISNGLIYEIVSNTTNNNNQNLQSYQNIYYTKPNLFKLLDNTERQDIYNWQTEYQYYNQKQNGFRVNYIDIDNPEYQNILEDGVYIYYAKNTSANFPQSPLQQHQITLATLFNVMSYGYKSFNTASTKIGIITSGDTNSPLTSNDGSYKLQSGIEQFNNAGKNTNSTEAFTDNRGKDTPFIIETSRNITYTELPDPVLRQQSLSAWREELQKVLCGAYGLRTEILTGERKFSNAETDQNANHNRSLEILTELLKEYITPIMHDIGLLPENIIYTITDKDSPIRKQQLIETANKLNAVDFLTIKEKREWIGFETETDNEPLTQDAQSGYGE